MKRRIARRDEPLPGPVQPCLLRSERRGLRFGLANPSHSYPMWVAAEGTVLPTSASPLKESTR